MKYLLILTLFFISNCFNTIEADNNLENNEIIGEWVLIENHKYGELNHNVITDTLMIYPKDSIENG